MCGCGLSRAGPSYSRLFVTSMAPKEPTKHQLSSRLTYSQHTPAFLRKLQSRVSGAPNEDSDEDPEFEDDGSGRPPIPRRPPIPERPADDPGSEDEDGDDEAPQVVVLKEGKHLSAREVENEKRKGENDLIMITTLESIPIISATCQFIQSFTFVSFFFLFLSNFITPKQRAFLHFLIRRRQLRGREIPRTPNRRTRRPTRKKKSPSRFLPVHLTQPGLQRPSGRLLPSAMATATVTRRVRTRTWHPASESAARRHRKSKRRRKGPRWASRSRTMRERCDARNRRVQCTYRNRSLVDPGACVVSNIAARLCPFSALRMGSVS